MEIEVQCCKEQYCIGTWNVRSMNEGRLEVVRQEAARVNVDILQASLLRGLCTAEPARTGQPGAEDRPHLQATPAAVSPGGSQAQAPPLTCL